MQHVICLGSWQGSDAVAWLLAERLEVHAQSLPALRIDRALSPLQMLDLFKGATALLLIDATRDLPAGELRMIAREALAHTPGCSSHGVDLLAALELFAALGELPAVLQILALGVGDSELPPEQIAELALPGVLAILRTL